MLIKSCETIGDCSLEIVRRIPFQRSVTAVAWHERLNQIFAGTGDKSFGEARILYDPEVSTRGALVCAGRAVRSADPLGLNAKQQIYAPNALPMYVITISLSLFQSRSPPWKSQILGKWNEETSNI